MASAQEAEQIIRSLNGGNKSFAKAIAAKDRPSVSFRIYDPDKVVIHYNDDGLTKADLEALCRPIPKGQMKEPNFRTVVVACKKVHIQSGNFSFGFQHNPFEPSDSMLRPVWVSPSEDIPNNLSCITLHLHDQCSKEDAENLRNIIYSQFEKLHE
ncbi:hypothetical protein FBEOM_14226, partial [Fusarium beomiforme]